MQTPISGNKMRRIDAIATERYGIPSMLLMENAGRAVSMVVLDRLYSMKCLKDKGSVALFCGSGNNGADGMVCARCLFYEHIRTRVYLVGKDQFYANKQTALHLFILKKMGVSVCMLTNKNDMVRLRHRFNADIIVDAIFGIGFHGIPKGIHREAIYFINQSNSYVVSVDLPSGLDATTGSAADACVKADMTVAMGFPKQGFYTKDGPLYTGKVRPVDIGLPKRIKKYVD